MNENEKELKNKIGNFEKLNDPAREPMAVEITPALKLSLPNGNTINGAELLAALSVETKPAPDSDPCKTYNKVLPKVPCPLYDPAGPSSAWEITPADADVLVRYGHMEENQLSEFQRTEIKKFRK